MTIVNQTPADANMVQQRFSCPTYLLRRKMLKLLGAKIDIYDPQENAVLCCFQKAFKLKEDISLFTDETKRVELIQIKARQIIDFSAAYDVFDRQNGEMIGTLRRKGWQSMVSDTWEILSPNQEVIAKITEDSIVLALLRRFITALVPQSFHYTLLTGRKVAEANQHFNPFIQKIDLIMPIGHDADLLDPRLVLASGVLLVLIEGRQD